VPDARLTTPLLALCNETRARRHGYQLRCLAPRAHDGNHRWTPELVDDPELTRPEH